jgi:Tfp pilus assembly protein PilF
LGAGAALLICAFLAIVILGRLRQPLQRARQLRNQNQVEQSLAEYEAAIRADPNQVAAYLEPAEMLMNRGQPGDYVRAADLCMRGLQVKREDEALHTCAARAWWASGDLENAAPHLDWLIQHKPDGGLAHAGMAIVQLQHGQIDQARDEAQRAVQLDPNAPECHLALGMVLLRSGQPQLAREQFRLVLNSPVALRWMKDQAQQK